MFVRALSFCTLALVLTVGCKGSRSRGGKPTPAVSAASAPSADDLAMPETAKSAALGVRWVLLAPGAGPVPNPEDQIMATATVRKPDGSPASKPPGPQPLSFTAYTLPEELREPMLALRSGAKARYWLPAAALGRWKPPTWETTDLVLDLEVKEVVVPKRIETAMDGKVPPGLEPKPDPLPPQDAKKSAKGYPYLRLIAGTGGVEPRRDARVRVRFSAWRVEGLVVTALAQDQAASVAMADAPVGVADLLSHMVEGDVLRIWLPPKAAGGLVPLAPAEKVVVDLGLAKIE